MSWTPATDAAVRIGGIVYRNVPQPITLNNRPLIGLSRNPDTDLLGVTLELRHQNGTRIASVVHSDVTVHDEANFVVAEGRRRKAIVEKNSGRIWCDIKPGPPRADYELDISCIFFSDNGYPVFLHPDRTKLGIANDNHAPSMSGLTITTAPGSMVLSGLSIRNSQIYLLGMAIEKVLIGLKIEYEPDNAPA